MTKSQSEIFGLVMIVFILAVVLVFVLGFFVMRASNQVVLPDGQIAVFLNAAILDATIDNCNDIRVKEALYDCAQVVPSSVMCEGGAVPLCDLGNPSNSAYSKAIDKILEKTVGTWEQPYQLEIQKRTDDNGVILYATDPLYKKRSSTDACQEDKVSSVIRLYLDADSTIEYALDLCTN